MSMSQIPYGRQNIGDDDVSEVISILKGDFLTTGPKVKEFENALANYVGANHAVAVNSGTSALDIAVAAINLPQGSEIITTPFTFVADSNCVLYNGHKPVFADIDPKTYNISPDSIKKKLTNKTKAIIYVDYAGQPCEIEEIREIASEHSLFLMEDACHALGAEYKGKKTGNFADMTIFSFHPVKHITTGEGGAITTNNSDFYEKLKLLRNHGIDKDPSERTSYKYDMKLLGRNYRITDFQCALGISQLKKLDKFLERRSQIARIYSEEFEKIDSITIPYVKPNVKHAWHLYTILLDKKINRDNFFEKMKNSGLGVNVHYIPVYRFSYYKQFNINPMDYPSTEEIFSRIISISMYPAMTDEDVKTVISKIKRELP